MTTFKLGDVIEFSSEYHNKSQGMIVSPMTYFFAVVSTTSGLRFGEAKRAEDLYSLSKEQVIASLGLSDAHDLKKVPKKCEWRRNEEHEDYTTTCNHAFGTLDNGKEPEYCPGCGKPVHLITLYLNLGIYTVPRPVQLNYGESTDVMYGYSIDEIIEIKDLPVTSAQAAYKQGFVFRNKDQAEAFRQSYKAFMAGSYKPFE